MRTDCFAHRCAQTSVRILTAAVRILTAAVRILTDVCAHLHRSDMQFRTDHSIPHRPNSSPPFYSVRICAHSVRMRTTTIFCAQCAQPLRTDILCCAHSVRILCACSPTSVRMRTDAHRRRCASSPLIEVILLTIHMVNLHLRNEKVAVL